MARTTIIRAVWNKLMTQLNKPEHANVLAQIKLVRQTYNPSMDTILWDPSKEALEGLLAQAQREISFTRDQKSKAWADLNKVIADLQGELTRLAAQQRILEKNALFGARYGTSTDDRIVDETVPQHVLVEQPRREPELSNEQAPSSREEAKNEETSGSDFPSTSE
jgi:hypothetical protein